MHCPVYAASMVTSEQLCQIWFDSARVRATQSETEVKIHARAHIHECVKNTVRNATQSETPHSQKRKITRGAHPRNPSACGTNAHQQRLDLDQRQERERERERERQRQTYQPKTYSPAGRSAGMRTRSTISRVGSAPPWPSSMPWHIAAGIPNCIQGGAKPTPVCCISLRGIGQRAHVEPSGVVPSVTYVPLKKISLPPCAGPPDQRRP